MLACFMGTDIVPTAEKVMMYTAWWIEVVGPLECPD